MRPLLAAAVLLALVSAFAADPPPKEKPRPVQVPFRLTDSKHVLVRVKIDGKGPFNFILDTGAPALFVSTEVCKKLGIAADAKGWAVFDRFEIEGGLAIRKARGRVDDPFQVEGMNQLGLAGAPLHGIIGYNLLARHRLTFDFSKDKMTWTPLDFQPPLPKIGDQKINTNAMGGMVKMMAALLGKRLEREVRHRGLLGAELAEKDGAVTIQTVLPGSPAGHARLSKGDQLTAIDGKPVASIKEAERTLQRHGPGDTVEIMVRRAGKEQSHKIALGKGF